MTQTPQNKYTAKGIVIIITFLLGVLIGIII